MFKIELLTDAGQYYLVKPMENEVTDDEKLLQQLVTALNDGAQIIVRDGEDRLTAINCGPKYQHVKVWKEEWEEINKAWENVPVGRPPGMPAWDTITYETKYLGTDVHLVMQQYTDGKGRYYLLPMEVDGHAAQDALSKDGLEFVVKGFVSENLPMDAVVTNLYPHTPIYPDWDEARAYITDYIKETTAQPGVMNSKNAKAWTGWNEGEKGV